VQTIRKIPALRETLRVWKHAGETVAIVPTLGNLHEGHISLLELARRQADRAIVSVFVNPTQFGPGEDYQSYPRTLDHDRRRLMRAGADLLFAPAVDVMYPQGEDAATVVSVPGLSAILCGEFRPGHFDGVTSVVSRLFNIVQPDFAIFGQKDYQQLTIIRRMAADLHFPVEIIAGPTLREADGLALSSRNQYLSAAERGIAPDLYRVVSECAVQLRAGAHDYAALEAHGMATLVAAGFRPDYFTVRNADDLHPAQARDRRLVVLVAAHLGRARLIDNQLVEI
jgi:pantoate--beta-alanine ligase